MFTIYIIEYLSPSFDQSHLVVMWLLIIFVFEIA